MTVALLKREAHASPLLSSGLVVERTDIVFGNVAAERVQIEITVHNRGEFPTPPTLMRIEAAPLGAFVPTRPLASLLVPRLQPGAAHTLRLQARPQKPMTLGGPDRVPPSRLLTALAMDDEDDAQQPGTLPADILDLFAQGSTHWAGNLNIFFAGKEVERHLAQALRIYPGQTNLAMFVVGQRDTYAFSLHGSGASWKAALFDGLSCFTRKNAPLAQDEWLKIDSGMIMLALCPPPDAAKSGEVEVHVDQRSTGKQAVVEFSLDAKAAGPGCFVV